MYANKNLNVCFSELVSLPRLEKKSKDAGGVPGNTVSFAHSFPFKLKAN